MAEKALVWGEELAVEVHSCRPGHLLQKWVPMPKWQNRVLLSEQLVSDELLDRSEALEVLDSKLETAY